jgi:hypothetical protein
MTPLFSRGTRRRGGRLSHFRRWRGALVAAGISQQPLRPFSCLAKHFALGVFFVLTIVALFLSNVAAAGIFFLFGILASLAMLFLWIVLSLKAWQGERFELPLFGEFAARLP